MSPNVAHPLAGRVNFAPSAATPAALLPQCHLPSRDRISVQADELLLRRAAWTLIELACVAAFLAAVLIWAAIGAGA